MSIGNMNIISSILKMKLLMSDRIIDRLPGELQPGAKDLRAHILTSLRDGLDTYLNEDKLAKETTGLQKIQLE